MASDVRSTVLRVLLPALLLVAAEHVRAQDDRAWRDSVDAYWTRLDAEFADSLTSPLTPDDRRTFTHIERFAPDPRFRVEAVFHRVNSADTIIMRTSTARLPRYKVHGTLTFDLDGRTFTVPVYENAVPDPRYPDHLFLPFTDLTNGEETYGAGRYLDLHAPLPDRVTLDLNLAYNPYCAYNHRYSCPIPPAANHLDVAVRAGAKSPH